MSNEVTCDLCTIFGKNRPAIAFAKFIYSSFCEYYAYCSSHGQMIDNIFSGKIITREEYIVGKIMIE